MDTAAELTLENLHVLAALSHNDKLLTNQDRFDIYSPTSVRGVYRMWLGEGRHGNVQRIRATIRSAIQFCHRALQEIDELLDHDGTLNMRAKVEILHFMRMCAALQQSRTGIENLEQTYREDPALVSHIQLTLGHIDDFVCLMRPHETRFQSQNLLPSPNHSP